MKEKGKRAIEIILAGQTGQHKKGNRMARQSGITAKTKEKFIAELSKTGNISQAARNSGLDRRRLYELRKKDEIFSHQWAEAEHLGVQGLIDEAIRRATKKDKPSDILLMFLIKGKDRRFKDRDYEERPDQPIVVRWARSQEEVDANS